MSVPWGEEESGGGPPARQPEPDSDSDGYPETRKTRKPKDLDRKDPNDDA
jgi:hypothetical protein